MSSPQENALISVYNKTDIDRFAHGLSERGWGIYASRGTASLLKNAGIEVTDVAELVGGEPILDHRVVTLSREVHAGILAQDTPEDNAELERLGIPRIDLVCVDMYPLREAIADPDATEESVIEQTDIGGPTMLRAAAKGRRIVLSRASQRQEVLDWLEAGRPDEEEFLRNLAAIAEIEVADYVLHSAKYIGGTTFHGSTGELAHPVKYGENAWQASPGLYAETDNQDPLAIHHFELRQGAEPSFNNYVDLERMLQTMTHIGAVMSMNFHDNPEIAVGVKHGNACGAAETANPHQAIVNMLDGDPQAIFGGSAMFNFPLDKSHAELLMTYGMEDGKRRVLAVVVAPFVTDEALEILTRKEGWLRVWTNPALQFTDALSLDTSMRDRYVRGGRLVQQNYDFVPTYPAIGVDIRALPESKRRDMLLAWAIGSTSNSNTITLVKDSMLIGNGVGQQDRISAALLALDKARTAGHNPEGSVAYSDSFFPFKDAPLELANAGVVGIFATHGSIRDDEVKQALDEAGVTFVTLPDSQARGFYGH